MAICCMNKGQLPFHKEYHVFPGWYDIIDRLHEELITVDPDYVVEQVKEKFGLLRIYIRSSEEAYAVVHRYEEESGHVCQQCGKPGTFRSDGWMRTLCDEDEEIRKNRWKYISTQNS